MTDFSVIDDTFDPNITSSYFLSIQVSLDGFSFCTLDPVRNTFIQMRHQTFHRNESPEMQVERCFQQFELLNLPFKKTLVLVPSRTATLIPSGIFETSTKEEWLGFCHTPPKDHLILYNKMKMADAYNVFSVPEYIHRIMGRQFPQPHFFHQFTPIIETNLATNILGGDQTALYLDLNGDYFDVVAFEKNNLKLCNSFPIKSENDFIYFTLFVFEQLKLKPSTTEVILSGRHPNYKTILKQLTQYIRQVKQAEMPRHFQYSQQFREVPTTGFQNLLNLSTCV